MSGSVPEFLDLVISSDVEQLTQDDTVGILSTYKTEWLPDSLLVDPERLERALIAYREVFDQPGAMNMTLVRKEEDRFPLLALYPEEDEQRGKAVVVAPRTRGKSDYEVKEIEE